MKQKTKCEEETPLSAKSLKEIADRKFEEWREADDRYQKSLSINYKEDLEDKFICYKGTGYDIYLHVRSAFTQQNERDEWCLYLQGLGFWSDITDYQDQCEFKWDWWTEIVIDRFIYDNDEKLSKRISFITEQEFRDKFDEAVKQMVHFNKEILDNKYDSPND